MKKVLCLVLSLIMTFSCLSVCMTASAADYRYRPDGSLDPDGKATPDIVGKVIDPILFGIDTVFADSINEIGYSSVNAIADGKTNTGFTNKSYITENNFYDFIEANAEDTMFGVSLGYLYENKNSNFFWGSMKYDLKVGDADAHEAEVKAAVAQGKKSTCAAKGAYDACNEVLSGFVYDYPLKTTDSKIFENIVEVQRNIFNEATRKNEIHYDYYYQFDKGNFGLIKANSNSQIINTISKKYGDGAIFATREIANKNAIKLANFIGNLIYPDFKEIKADKEVFTNNKTLKSEDFFRKVTELSGLDVILDEYWCNAKDFDVKNIMAVFGVTVSEGAIFNIELEKGVYMGGRILSDIYREFMKNPVDYTLQVLQNFARNYSALYKKPLERLFSLKLPTVVYKSRETTAAGVKKYPLIDNYTGNELDTVDGLINFVSDVIYITKVDKGETNPQKFDFAPLPIIKFATAADNTELYLYMLCYCELNRIFVNDNAKTLGVTDYQDSKFPNNGVMIDAFIEKVSTGNEDTVKVLKALFKGELTFVDIQSFYLGKLTGNTMENFPDNFKGSVRKAIVGFFQNLLEAMDNFMNLLFGWTGGLFGKE